MPDYQKGQIYKLWSPQGEEDEIYFGSTTDKLYKRKASHKTKYNKCQSKILIELLEDYPCNSRAELEKKEGEYIRNNKCLNKVIPDRTIKEWRDDNKESIKENMKEYCKINKEALAEQKKEYRENNKEQIAEYTKKYYENNKEHALNYQKNYKENNKEQLKEWRDNNVKQKMNCECDCIITKFNLKRHQQSPKHIKLMEEKNNLGNI